MFRKVVKRELIGLAIVGVLAALGLPRLLNSSGLHADNEIPEFDLSGKRAPIVTTSHDVSDSTSTEGADQQATLTSEAFLGTYEFSGGQEGRKNWTSSIETVASEMSLLMRGMAKKRLSNAAAIREWIAFSIEDERLIGTDSSGATLTGDCDGKRYEIVTPDGKNASLMRSLSRNDEGLLVLTEQRMADAGSRTHRYILSESGDAVLLEVSIESGRLPRALEYALTYDRKH